MTFSWGPLHAGLQSVLDTALDAVVVMDVSDRVIGWNRHATAIFGWNEAEAVGQNLSGLIIPEQYREQHERGLAHFLATGEGPVLDRRIEISGLHKHGHEFPVELSITCSDQFGETLFVGFMRDISARHALVERQQRLLKESDHRVKNMLTVVAAIAQQTARNSKDLDEFQASFSDRLGSLAKAHQLLVGPGDSRVALSALAEQVLGGDVAEGRARFSGPELLLGPTQLLGLSMILHELYTNAVKYGALCSDRGTIALDWEREGEALRMVWREKGPPCNPPGSRSGFGHRMIAMAAKADLGGEIDRDWRPDGLTVTLRFPLA
ncbi:MAG TPA: HWE histidine kinase domain-containing protein, partial [Sphingomicrobium sp.]|nr:HWE histidine kinase domain-containing protein [Sphingomicrobium sp.]